MTSVEVDGFRRTAVLCCAAVLGCSGLLIGCSREAPGHGDHSHEAGPAAGATTMPAGPSAAGVGAPSAGTQAIAGTSGEAGAGGSPTGVAGSGGGVPIAGMGGAPIAGSGGPQAGVGGGAAGAPAAGSGGGEAQGGIDKACKAWPEATGTMPVLATIRVTGMYDGKLQRFMGSGSLGGGGQDEGQDPLFDLAPGAVLKNVIVGAPAADGIHCNGECTLQNVWWEDVGEDAATLLGNDPSQHMTVDCGGARAASDKVFQHNGPGTIVIRNFYAQDIGKLYRSCGNCRSQFKRQVEISAVDITKAKVLAGVNTNYRDSARFQNITIHDSSMKTQVCDRFTGNSSGDEPTKTGSGPDAMYCLYAESDIHWLP